MGLPRNKKYTEREYVESMIEYCENLLEDTKRLGRQDFFSNRRTYNPVLWSLIKLGWIAYNLPRDLFDLYPHVDRRRILVVGYVIEKAMVDWGENPDYDFIWSVIQETVPELYAVLKKLQRTWQKSVEDIPEEDRVSKKVRVPVEV